MPFNSYEFLIFFVIFISLYYISAMLSSTLQKCILLFGNYGFYGFLTPWLCLLPLYLTIVQYVIGNYIFKFQSENQTSKKLLWCSIVASLTPLLFLKYSYLINQSWILPLGLSFYTLQAMSYSLDIYHKKMRPDSLFNVAVFVSFFPTMLSGPIERARNILPQIQKHSFCQQNLWNGTKLLIWGLLLKTVIANHLQIYVDNVYLFPKAHNGLTWIVTSLAYSIQIFSDFCGYSFLAMGCAKMLGFDVLQNFKAPYLAKSMKDFWHRWNISLTSWFTEYVYISLGGNRCTKLQWTFNIFIVFVLSGLWHGATITFIVWGALHAIFYIFDTMFIKRQNMAHSLLVFVCVTVAWIFFRSPDFGTALLILSKILSVDTFNLYLGSSSFSLIITLPFILLMFYKMYCEYYGKNCIGYKPLNYAILLSLTFLFGTDSTRFIYMNF